MKTKLFLALAALLGAAAFIPSAQAGLFTPVVLRDISSNSPVDLLLSTNGTPFAAANFGSMSNVVRNGVSFPAAGVAPNPLGVNWSAVASSVDTNLGGFVAIDRLFFSEMFGANLTSVTVSNLNPDRTYLVQILHGEPRLCCTGTFATNSFLLSSGSQLPVPAFTLGNGIGAENPPHPQDRAIVEVELSSITSFTYRMFRGVGRGPSIAGFQVRELPAPTNVPAATVEYVGFHPDLAAGWRTPTVAKPLDPDADNVIGTDGYHLINLPPVWPSYVASTEILSGTTAGNASYASIDNPAALPALFQTGAMTAAPGAGASTDLFRFTLGATAVGRTITVGLLVDNLDNAALNAASMTLVQTAGGAASSVSVATASAPFGNRTPDWLFFDITGASAGATFTVRQTGGANGAVALGGVAFDSVANFTPASNFNFQTTFAGTNIGYLDGIGGLRSMAVSGDTMVVGGRRTNSVLPVTVLVRNGGNWAVQALLTGHNTEITDRFGNSVAIHGDTVIVGAMQESSAANTINAEGNDNFSVGSGAAYVFVRSGTNWTQQAYLKASDSVGSLRLGSSVTLFGDTAVVGAIELLPQLMFVDRPSTSGNAAYVFVRSGTNWTQQAKLTASNRDSADFFGHSLELFDDTLVVGAPREDSNATMINGPGDDNSVANSGAAYVFVRSGTNWTQQAYLKAGNNNANNPTDAFGVNWDQFGWSVSISGNTVAIGAPLEDSWYGRGLSANDRATNNGAVYVFVRSGTNWSQQAMLKASNEPYDCMGRTVSISGDTVLAGNHFHPESTYSAANTIVPTPTLPATYVFQRAGGQWIRQADLLGSVQGQNNGGLSDETTALSGGKAVILNFESGTISVYDSTAPRLVVEDGFGTTLAFGGIDQKMAIQDGQPQSLTFTVRNLGNATLADLSASVDGADASHFTVTAAPSATVVPGGSTTFTVRFAAPSGPYPKLATLRLVSNDFAQGSFVISLTGLNLLSTVDSDADGLSDVAEFRLSTLGFDYLTRQIPEVNAYLGGASAAGYYTAAQVQALNVGTPLLSQTAPGQFKLTLGVQKATQLTNFVAFPFLAPQTTINGQGQLEFLFSSPDDAAFYRLEAR